MTTFRRRITGARPRVDVVVTHRNQGASLGPAIESIRHQAQAVQRTVVVDHGSDQPFSLETLERLEETGSVEVLRIPEKSHGAACNAAVHTSQADAIAFLDADEVMDPRHLERAMATLAQAPWQVGLAYPDLRLAGDLGPPTVLPAYNLYQLSGRHLCLSAVVVDTGVFAAGFGFTEDDSPEPGFCEFVARVGEAGIRGADFHGAPLQVRDPILMGDHRSPRHRPLAYPARQSDPAALLAIKHAWAPALSIVTDHDQTLAQQTCGDYDLVSGPDAPPVRGRWVAVVDDESPDILGDADFVERTLRVLSQTPTPHHLALLRGEAPPHAVRWQAVEGPGSWHLGALVLDNSTYEQWRRSASTRPEGTRLIDRLAASVPATTQWRWSGREWVEAREGQPGGPAEPALAPPQAPGDAGEDHRVVTQALDLERNFRLTAAPLYFARTGLHQVPVPVSGYLEGAQALAEGAWSDWTPSETVALDLVVDLTGRVELVADGAEPERSFLGRGPRIPLGRIWRRRFPGTAVLCTSLDVETHSRRYRVSDEEPADAETLLGYLATEALSDTVRLDDRIDAAMTMATALCGTVIPAQLVAHDEVFVEPPHPLPDPLLVQQRGRRGRRLSSDAGPSWPLYEVVVGGGRIRYSTDPDDCVVHPEGITRPTDRTVGELEAATSEGPSLCEVAWGADGRGYVTGPLDGADASPVRVLGGFASVPDVAYPLVRLGPGPQVPAPAGEPGHRLAVDWVPLTRSGYLIEGVVGYVWSNDPWRSPLYRWDSADGRRLTLGPGPEGWTLRGTLGLAFHRNCERAGLVDLWEMTRNDSVHYAVDPQESEAQGFRAERVVARIFGDDRPGALPLFSIRRGDGDSLCTTCPAEAGDEAAASPVVLGFVEPAHPPEPAFAVPAVTGPDLVGIEIADETGSSIRARLFSAPFPGSVPVSETPGPKGRLIVGDPDAGETNRVLGYAAAGPLVFGAPLFRLAAASGQDRLSTQPPHDGRERIVEVACYLPTARVL